jgi:hypothetical protein
MPLSQKTCFFITLDGEPLDDTAKTQIKEAIDWYCLVRVSENLQAAR